MIVFLNVFIGFIKKCNLRCSSAEYIKKINDTNKNIRSRCINIRKQPSQDKTDVKIPYLKRRSRQNILTNHGGRKVPIFWRSNNGDLGVIFKKEDKPEIMLKRERINNILSKKIENEEDRLRRSYIVNHPVLKLFANNLSSKRIFLYENDFKYLKKVYGRLMKSDLGEKRSLEKRSKSAFIV